MLLEKNYEEKVQGEDLYGGVEYQVLGGRKGASDQVASWTKTELVGSIKKSGSKLNIRRPGTRWVGSSKQSGSE